MPKRDGPGVNGMYSSQAGHQLCIFWLAFRDTNAMLTAGERDSQRTEPGAYQELVRSGMHSGAPEVRAPVQPEHHAAPKDGSSYGSQSRALYTRHARPLGLVTLDACVHAKSFVWPHAQAVPSEKSSPSPGSLTFPSPALCAHLRHRPGLL
jgi:hypothetical protein